MNATEAEAVEKAMAFIKKARPRSLTREERLDILQLHCHLRKHVTQDVSGKIATMLGRGERTVKDVWAEFLVGGGVVPVPPPSNTSNHKKRVPSLPATVQLVQKFIRDRCITRTRTVAKDVMALLIEKSIVSVKVGNKKDEAACLRAVQYFLKKHGYKRGKRSGKTSYRISPQHALARDAYVQYMVPVVTVAPKRPVVYIDESFIHHHYSRHNDSLFDPEDETETKPKHKGRRFCFIAGILEDGQGAGKLLGLDIFEGGKKNGKTVEDYHSMFNHDYFSEWFVTLLDEVEALGYSSVVFVMDNAKYHKTKPESTPSGKWKKAQLLEACQKFNLPSCSSDLRSTLWARLKAYIATAIDPVVVACARARGHDVLYTAPGYSELQPIEMIWAKVKGDVGRQYSTTTSFQDVRERLDAAFASLTPSTISSTIAHSTNLLLDLHKDLLAADEAHDQDPSSSDESGVSSADSDFE